MADVKISNLPEDVSPAIDDLITTVDVAASASKKVTLRNVIAPFLPPGVISVWAGASAPSNWLLCDGSDVSRLTYAALFAEIGEDYGVGDGATTFTLPNLKGRVVVGIDAAQSEFNGLGETGGAKTHTLTQSEMPSHTHTAGTNSTGEHQHNYLRWSALIQNAVAPSDSARYVVQGESYDITPGGQGSHHHGITVNATGGGGAHNNLQPYISLNYIIKT